MKTRLLAGPPLAVALAVAAAVACSKSPAATSGGTGGTTPSSSSTGGGSDGGPFETAAHSPFPVLPPNDSSEILMPRLVVIVGPGDPLADQLFSFGDTLVESAWFKAVGHDYGIAPTAGPSSLHLTGAAVPAVMDETALRAYVTATIAANPAAATDGHTVYLFFYPPGSS